MRRGQGHVYSMCVSVYTSVFAPDRPGRLPRAGAQTRGAGLPIGHRTPRRARPGRPGGRGAGAPYAHRNRLSLRNALSPSSSSGSTYSSYGEPNVILAFAPRFAPFLAFAVQH